MTTHLLPYRIENIGKTRIIHFLDPEALDLSVGFFRDTLNLAETPVSRHITPLPAYLKGPAVQEDTPAPVIIFHVSRCGSTLLCQNLKATGRFIVLGEPTFICKTLADTTLPHAEKTALTRRLVREWARWANRQGKRLVIKLSSSINSSAPEAIDVLGPAQLLGLYRDPAPVLESLTRKTPRHVEKEQAWSGGKAPSKLVSEIHALPETETITAEVKRTAGYIALSLQAMEILRDAGGIMLEYSELAPNFDALLQRLVPKGRDPSDTYRWNAEWAAKSRRPEQVPYQPVTSAHLRQFIENHKPVLTPLNVAYKTLRNGTTG